MTKFRVEHNFQSQLDVLKSIWGNELQEAMNIEEMSELTKELMKKYRGKEVRENIIGEIADVLITTLQMANIYGYEEVMDVLDFKINRGIERSLSGNN